MILDDLTHSDRYASLGSGAAAAFRFLTRAALDTLEPGRHDIDGSRVFALVSDYDTKPADAYRWEAHRRHVDIQVLATGSEVIGVAPLSTLRPGPFDEEKDILFSEVAHGDFVTLQPGRFVMLFPTDAHKPGVQATHPERVRKVVVKVAVDTFERA